MKLLKACELAKKNGAVTIGDVILYVENNSNKLFSLERIFPELTELVTDGIDISDDMLIDDYVRGCGNEQKSEDGIS